MSKGYRYNSKKEPNKMNDIKKQFKLAIKDSSICKIAIADRIDTTELIIPKEEYKWLLTKISKRRKNRGILLEVIGYWDNGIGRYNDPVKVKIKEEAFKEAYNPILKDGTFILRGEIVPIPETNQVNQVNQVNQGYNFSLAIRFFRTELYIPS